jgi:hypothetical protein
MLDCGSCDGGATCGGGGVDHVCGGAPGCKRITCAPAAGGQYCGVIGDGCGGTIDCGSCGDGGACGSDGFANVCPGTAGLVCTNLQCQVDQCSAGATTALTGTVYDPAGVNPIYNAVVYVPNAALEPVPSGASCDRCGATASGKPITATLTDTAGRFRLTGVPTGMNIPLVIQVGKWRRRVTIPTVSSCVDNPIADKELTRLPRRQAEGSPDDNIPRIAVTTGEADALECLLRRIGVADTEFTSDSGNGRVHLYVGGESGGDGAGTDRFASGGTFSKATALWADTGKMKGYDILMFSCEGSQYAGTKSPYLANIEAYMNAGGRTFLSHLHFYWLNHGSDDLQGTADYIGVGSDLPEPAPGLIDTSFPKGAALADWMMSVGATKTRGQLDLYQGQHSVAGVTPPTQRWIYVEHNPNEDDKQSIQYMTFNTPVTAAEANQCGRVVFTDLHVNTSVMGTGGDESKPDDAHGFPKGCKTNDMSPQAKALEFVFFDLSACVSPDNSKPRVPPPPPPPVGAPPPMTTPPPAPPPPPPPPPPPIR